MKKEIKLADKAGFCFGVKRAVDEALKFREQYNKKIYTLGPLIHNSDAVNFLKDKDIYPIDIEEIESLTKGDVIIIRSHGVSKSTYDLLEEKGLIVEDATCPYVTNIQKKAQQYYDKGFRIVIVGDKDHPEVIGINGWCNNSAIVYKNGEFSETLPRRVCLVSQTTQKQADFEKAVLEVSKTCKEFVVFNTICSATEERQKSAFELSKNVDAVVVIGGKHSSNTTKLYEICKSNCENTIHVERAEEIPSEFLNSGYDNIGVTAGASTPEWIINEALAKVGKDNNSDADMKNHIESNIVDMNDVLNYMDSNNSSVHIGERITGKIISVAREGLYVDLKYKDEGFIPRNEASYEEEVDLKEKFRSGEEIEAQVIKIKNEHGNVVLSRVELEKDKIKNEIEDIFKTEQVIEVKVSKAINGGLICKYKGVNVFLPASLVDLKHVEDLSEYVNKTIEVKIIEFIDNEKKEKIVASRKAILIEDSIKNEENSWNSIEENGIYEGEVKRISDFGAFVNIKGIDGLLHLSEISWGKINSPKEVLKIGEKLNVKVINIDRENKKLGLSIKELTPNPWDNAHLNYPVGNIALGKVVRFADFGAFVELEPGIDGLVHLSQISHNKINKPGEVLEINESVKVKILDVKPEEKRIALSIKAVE
ncbi:bifunctional 4-hydroxy-3-methylbut-2-enyl diphosphate reductase/30S ribosomal protein S1 [Clostridium hydrogeniformans]|uniref:bifunctional 4-hydroxy-3-methylbut-2-enyl diphosphate reductase/30S ribosomal protein S1 n=1 Tax=Clostridium hydrogeniformans TaxID=349933 RepID=UPI000554086D|nr:bifunctional 4-hydroxy-3-methylbut-2-enyl diphosphate reductase/30S ribosomal protein S1 [Clostridium hydrogeniformans]